jgi:hypothetical protein
MIPWKVRVCPGESAHRSGVAWWIEAESKRDRVENGQYLLVGGRWRSRVGDGLHRYLRYEANAKQVLARVLASSVRSGLACCGETTPVVVSGARTTPNMAPAGVPASSARSGPTADEVPPPAWPRLPRLLLLRREGWRGKPECSSSATGGSCRRVRRCRASRRPLLLSRCGGGGEYHVVVALKGHEHETPEA